jgi:hypothetical protein
MEKPSIKISQSLRSRLATIQASLKVPKTHDNTFAKFKYRNCEDILEAVKPLLGDLVLKLEDEVVQIGDRYYVKATVYLWDGVETFQVSAFAREAESKTGMDSAQVTGATSSYARKYALNGLFAIDDTVDADSQDNRPAVTTKTYAKNPLEPTPNYPKKRVVGQAPAKSDLPLSPTLNLDNVLPGPAFTDEQGVIKRDPKGHTACVSCGAVVSAPVEQFALKKYGKVLCMRCQKKETA